MSNDIVSNMPHLRIQECARLLGVSDDTVRRLIQTGSLVATPDAAGRLLVDGATMARYARGLATASQELSRTSARNHLPGIVTAVTIDGVMAQVELQCGPFRVVSLMSSEAVTDLGLEVGSLASAVVKSTNVIVDSDQHG